MKPPRLNPGHTIGIVSPSFGAVGMFPHRTQQGLEQIQRLGYCTKLAEHASQVKGAVSDSPENRAADLHQMFLDPEVHAIIAGIGGDHSNHLLPLLDFDLIAKHPKIFMGYSDITVLNVAIWRMTSLTTFNGPAFITDFAEYPEMFDYTRQYFLKTLTQAEPVGVIEPAKEWTEEFQDWREQKDRERPRRMETSPGWNWIKEGHGQGVLIGGCLESLHHLRGTRYWPDWYDSIFFWEISEEKPSPSTVDSILMDYENMGVFNRLRGMIAGRPFNYSEEEKQQLREVILERTRKYRFPIITDMDFGHTAPQFLLPIGCRGEINSSDQTFRIIDPAVS